MFDFEAGEILLIAKPIGWTSFDVVNKLKKALKIKKVGHTGTLDPFAAGLLIVLTGRKTKESAAFQQLPKTYRGILELGKTTDTLDIEGKTTETKPVPDLTKEHVEKVLKSFMGESLQVPPVYSALKIRGERAYKLARRNKPVHLEPRKIEIYAIQLLDFLGDKIYFQVNCSKGTYIRSLGRDIAERLETVGYIKALVRTQIGQYSLDDAVDVNEFIDSVGQKDH